MIAFRCPSCQANLQAKLNSAGEKIFCGHCGQKLQIPIPRNKTVLGELLENPVSSVSFLPVPLNSAAGDSPSLIGVQAIKNKKSDSLFIRMLTLIGEVLYALGVAILILFIVLLVLAIPALFLGVVLILIGIVLVKLFFPKT